MKNTVKILSLISAGILTLLSFTACEKDVPEDIVLPENRYVKKTIVTYYPVAYYQDDQEGIDGNASSVSPTTITSEYTYDDEQKLSQIYKEDKSPYYNADRISMFITRYNSTYTRESDLFKAYVTYAQSPPNLITDKDHIYDSNGFVTECNYSNSSPGLSFKYYSYEYQNGKVSSRTLSPVNSFYYTWAGENISNIKHTFLYSESTGMVTNEYKLSYTHYDDNYSIDLNSLIFNFVTPDCMTQYEFRGMKSRNLYSFVNTDEMTTGAKAEYKYLYKFDDSGRVELIVVIASDRGKEYGRYEIEVEYY